MSAKVRVEVTSDGKQEFDVGKEPLNKDPKKKKSKLKERLDNFKKAVLSHDQALLPVTDAMKLTAQVDPQELELGLKYESMQAGGTPEETNIKVMRNLTQSPNYYSQLMQRDPQQFSELKPNDITEDQVDPEQLASGVEVESEHTDSPEVAKKIALHHLAEDPEYYIKLKTYVEPDPNTGVTPGQNMEDMANELLNEGYSMDEITQLVSQIEQQQQQGMVPGQAPMQPSPEEQASSEMGLQDQASTMQHGETMRDMERQSQASAAEHDTALKDMERKSKTSEMEHDGALKELERKNQSATADHGEATREMERQKMQHEFDVQKKKDELELKFLERQYELKLKQLEAKEKDTDKKPSKNNKIDNKD